MDQQTETNGTGKKMFNARLEPTLIARLQSTAKRADLSMSSIVREALWEKIAQIESTHPAFNPPAEVEQP